LAERIVRDLFVFCAIRPFGQHAARAEMIGMDISDGVPLLEGNPLITSKDVLPTGATRAFVERADVGGRGSGDGLRHPPQEVVIGQVRRRATFADLLGPILEVVVARQDREVAWGSEEVPIVVIRVAAQRRHGGHGMGTDTPWPASRVHKIPQRAMQREIADPVIAEHARRLGTVGPRGTDEAVEVVVAKRLGRGSIHNGRHIPTWIIPVAHVLVGVCALSCEPPEQAKILIIVAEGRDDDIPKVGAQGKLGMSLFPPPKRIVADRRSAGGRGDRCVEGREEGQQVALVDLATGETGEIRNDPFSGPRSEYGCYPAACGLGCRRVASRVHLPLPGLLPFVLKTQSPPVRYRLH